MTFYQNRTISRVVKLASIALPALIGGNTYANKDVKPSYPPLPAYGFVSFNSASCVIGHGITGPTGVTWSASPQGYGYPASQYQCSGVLTMTNLASGGSCQGTFSSITTPPAGMFTDGAGNLNPGDFTGVVIAGTATGGAVVPKASCSGIAGATAGIPFTISMFAACGLAIGGNLDVLLTGTSANCTTS